LKDGGVVMSMSWYPVIDMEKCTNCRACYDLSNCGAFEIFNDRVIVAYPEEGIWECLGG
jgi:TPP-dependent indolepyruvate ferredoxin oxidoreductase alpha subunit